MANEVSVVLKMQEDISAHLKSIASTSVGCSKGGGGPEGRRG